MYDKLLNKNVITATLVSLMVLGVTKTCDAQGVVSLVEEENVVLPQDNTSEVIDESGDFDEFSLEINAEIPDTLPEDEGAIPLDDEAFISPAPVTTSELATDSDSALANEPISESINTATENQAAVNNDVTVAQEPVQVTADVANTSNFDNPIDNQTNVDVQNDTPLTAQQENTPDENFDLGLQETLPEEVVVQNSVAQNDSPLAPSAAVNTQRNMQDVKENFANSVLSKIDNDLFAQMSDIEKQTTLLTLELRREKLRSEIEAVKAQRTKAEEEKIAAQEAKERQELEWQKEQELKIYKEQQLLKEKEIELEKIKQKKALVAYMNKMLEDKQKWINENAKLLKKLKEVENNRNEIAENFKDKLNNLVTLSNKFIQSVNSAKSNHDRTIASLTAQNIQLKKRLEAEVAAAQNAQQNPFSSSSSSDNIAIPQDETLEPQIDITQEYAIMDITGKNNSLVAKLINKEGDAFLVRTGTVLQTGHSVEEITPSYIKFNKKGSRQFLYSGNSIEPEKFEGENVVTEKPKKQVVEAPAPKTVGDSSAPTLGSGMFVK